MEIATNCTRKFCQIRKGYMLTCASHEARICNTPRKPKKHWLFGERKINNNKSYNFKVGDQFENGVGYPVIIFGFEYWTFKDINIVGIRNNMVAPGSATKTKGSCAQHRSHHHTDIQWQKATHHYYHRVQTTLSVPSTID